MVTYHGVFQGTPEWHDIRKGKITASNAKILLTKGANEAVNQDNNFKGNYYTSRGHTLESEAIELYEQIIQMRVAQVGFVTNDKYPNCGYSPDGILPDRIIEVKAFNESKHLASHNDIPFDVMAQIQFGLMISEMPVGVLVLYNPDINNIDQNLLLKVIPRDDKIIANIERKLSKWKQ
jgi:hypothetical protein